MDYILRHVHSLSLKLTNLVRFVDQHEHSPSMLYFPVLGFQHVLLCLPVYMIKWFLKTNTLTWATIWIIFKAPRYFLKILFLTTVLSKDVGDKVKLTELPVVKLSVSIDLSVSRVNFCTKDIIVILFIFNYTLFVSFYCQS